MSRQFEKAATVAGTMMMKAVRILAVAFLAIGISGCGGGGARVQQQTTTLGQELQDLEAAYKKGIIGEEQYEDLREEIIEKYTD